MIRRALIVYVAGILLLSTSCATTPSAKSDTASKSQMQAESRPTELPAENQATAKATPAATPSPTPADEESPAAVKKTAASDLDQPASDNVDDDDSLPPATVDLSQALSQDSSARKDFEDAVMVAGAEPGRAMGLFEQAAKRDPNFILAWHNAAVAAERQGQMDKAVGFYRKALALHADFYPSLSSLVKLYLRHGKRQEARSLAEQSVRASRQASTLTALGLVELATGSVSKAETQAKAALKLDEKSVPAMLLLADSFFAQKKYELSRFVLNNAKEIEPNNALVYQALGRALLAQDKQPAALNAFAQAVTLRQDLPEAFNNLAVLYFDTGDIDAALSASKNAVELAPKLAPAWENYGNALRAKKRYTEAIAAYTKAASLDKTSPSAAFDLGILYLDNPVDKLDEVQRMDMALKYFADYKARARMQPEQAERLEKYITQAQRKRGRVLKRRERAAKRKAKEEAKKKAEAEAKIKAEAEAKRQAEEAAKAKVEAERKAAEEAKRLAEAEAKKKAEQEARVKAEQEARQRKLGGGGK